MRTAKDLEDENNGLRTEYDQVLYLILVYIHKIQIFCGESDLIHVSFVLSVVIIVLLEGVSNFLFKIVYTKID